MEFASRKPATRPAKTPAATNKAVLPFIELNVSKLKLANKKCVVCRS
jgi:hypothetical protein